MTTKDTMTNTQTLALAYAEKLVEYYSAKITGDDAIERRAYNALCTAQNALAYAAECEAENA
jgi:hypothetical protein